jgi:hypothetical protein
MPCTHSGLISTFCSTTEEINIMQNKILYQFEIHYSLDGSKRWTTVSGETSKSAVSNFVQSQNRNVEILAVVPVHSNNKFRHDEY